MHPKDFLNTLFISYSRKNIEDAEILRQKLGEYQFDALFDKYDIVAGEPWQERLSDMISSANSVIFLISKESIKSDVCAWEIDEAERLSKRIFPVLLDATEISKVPGRLQRLNFTFLNGSNNWQQEFEKLVHALSSDIEWVREHTNLTQAAHIWNKNDRISSYLLRSGVIFKAEKILQTQPKAYQVLSPLLLDFLEASRELEKADRNFKRSIIQRSFVEPAKRAFDDGKFDSALRKIAAGALLSDDPNLNLEQDANVNEKNALWRTAIAAASQDTLVKKILHCTKHIRGIQISKNDKLLLSFFYTGEVAVWDIDSMETCFTIEEPEEKINYALLLEDDKTLMSCSENGVISLWDMKTRSILNVFKGHEEQINTICISPDKRIFASGEQSKNNKQSSRLIVWDFESGRQRNLLKQYHSDWVRSVAFNADQTHLISTSLNEIFIHDLSTNEAVKLRTVEYVNKQLKAEENSWIHSNIFSHHLYETKQLLVIIRHFSVKTREVATSFQIWDTTTYEILSAHMLKDVSFTDAELLLDEMHVIAPIKNEYMAIFNIETGKQVKKLQMPCWEGSVVAQSKCHQFIAVSTKQRSIVLFDLSSDKLLATYSGHTGPITALTFSNCGTWFASSGGHYANPSVSHDGESRDNTVRLWSTKFKRPHNIFNNQNKAWAVCVSDDSRFVSVAYPEEGILSLDQSDNKVYVIKTPKNFKGPYDVVNHSKYSHMLLSDGYNSHNILYCRTGKTQDFEVVVKPEQIVSSALCQGGSAVAFGDKNGIVFVKTINDSEMIDYHVHKKTIIGLCFNATGKILVSLDSSGQMAIKKLGVDERPIIFNLNERDCNSILINKQADSLILVRKNTLLIFNKQSLTTNDEKWIKIAELTEHVNFIGGPVSLAFHPNGHIAASGSWGVDNAYIWDTRTGAKLGFLSGHSSINALTFCPGGRDLFVCSEKGVLKWDVSTFASFNGNKLEYLSSVLGHGLDVLSFSESNDLLMKNAHSPLLEALKGIDNFS